MFEFTIHYFILVYLDCFWKRFGGCEVWWMRGLVDARFGGCEVWWMRGLVDERFDGYKVFII